MPNFSQDFCYFQKLPDCGFWIVSQHNREDSAGSLPARAALWHSYAGKEGGALQTTPSKHLLGAGSLLSTFHSQHSSLSSAQVWSSCPTLWLDGLGPARLLCPWNFPGENTGAVAIAYSRGSLTQGSNPHFLGLLHWQAGSFTTSATWEAQESLAQTKKTGNFRSW